MHIARPMRGVNRALANRRAHVRANVFDRAQSPVHVEHADRDAVDIDNPPRRAEALSRRRRSRAARIVS